MQHADGGDVLPHPDQREPNGTSKVGAADKQRINIEQDHEVRYWCVKLRVTSDVLRDAGEKAGPMGDDIAKQLGDGLRSCNLVHHSDVRQRRPISHCR